MDSAMGGQLLWGKVVSRGYHDRVTPTQRDVGKLDVGVSCVSWALRVVLKPVLFNSSVSLALEMYLNLCPGRELTLSGILGLCQNYASGPNDSCLSYR